MSIAFEPSSVLDVVLSNGNLTGTNNNTVNPMGCKTPAASAKSAGKLYFEIVGLSPAGGGQSSVSLDPYTTSFTDVVSSGSASPSGGVSLFVGGNGIVFQNGGSATVGLGGTTAATDVIAVAVDMGAGKIWFKNVTKGFNWNGLGSADPATGTLGVAFTANPVVPFIGWGGSGVSVGQAVTANFAGPFVGAEPSGYSAWDSSGPPPAIPTVQLRVIG